MKQHVAIAIMSSTTGSSGLDPVGQLRPVFPAWLSDAIDRLIIGLALAAPMDSGEVLDLRYADAMVGVFDQWFIAKGLRTSSGVSAPSLGKVAV